MNVSSSDVSGQRIDRHTVDESLKCSTSKRVCWQYPFLEKNFSAFFAWKILSNFIRLYLFVFLLARKKSTVCLSMNRNPFSRGTGIFMVGTMPCPASGSAGVPFFCDASAWMKSDESLQSEKGRPEKDAASSCPDGAGVLPLFFRQRGRLGERTVSGYSYSSKWFCTYY